MYISGMQETIHGYFGKTDGLNTKPKNDFLLSPSDFSRPLAVGEV